MPYSWLLLPRSGQLFSEINEIQQMSDEFASKVLSSLLDKMRLVFLWLQHLAVFITMMK